MTRRAREYLSSVTLVITGDDLDPDYVSRRLSLRPDRTWRKGDERSVGPRAHKYPWGGWKRFVDRKVKDKYLEEQLQYWVSLLTGWRNALRAFQKREWSCVLSCFIGTNGTASVVLPADFQRELMDFGVDIEISMFAGDRDAANKGAAPDGDHSVVPAGRRVSRRG